MHTQTYTHKHIHVHMYTETQVLSCIHYMDIIQWYTGASSQWLVRLRYALLSLTLDIVTLHRCEIAHQRSVYKVEGSKHYRSE